LKVLDQAEILLKELFLDYHKMLMKWSDTTGQSSQLDSGYIAQHLISLLTGIKGSGMRGKGKDLQDDSEIKTASSVAGVDVPRWNQPMGATEESRVKKMNEFLKHPSIYYVLFDTRKNSDQVRVRVWKVLPESDADFQKVVRTWDKMFPPPSYNFQLHPPVRKDSNVATNEAGNIDLPLMFEAREDGKGLMKVHLFDPSNRKSKYIPRGNRSQSKLDPFH